MPPAEQGGPPTATAGAETVGLIPVGGLVANVALADIPQTNPVAVQVPKNVPAPSVIVVPPKVVVVADEKPMIAATPVDPIPLVIPKTGVAAAQDALNTFSNYCFVTLAADNARIEKITNQKVNTRMDRLSQRLQEKINSAISHQQAYLDTLAPGAEADASLARSNPNLVAVRQSTTNILNGFTTEIDNALRKQ